MARSGQFTWEGDFNGQAVGSLDRKVKRAMVAVAGRYAPKAEAWMKTNARWTDRTGNARNGLGALAFSDANHVAVVLFHQVPYGVWLEVRWDGRYAVIEPAIQKFAPEMMAMVARLAFSRGGA